MAEHPEGLLDILGSLRSLVQRNAVANLTDKGFFLNCLSSSVVKAFEFVEIASQQDESSAFFLTPGLRSIAEDIIVLQFLARVPHESRELVVSYLFELEISENAKHQREFFQRFRPFQPVMPERINNAPLLKKELQSFWRNNGWPGFNRKKHPIIPPVREIAQHSSPGLLEIVYEFIYRISSSAVHFSPSTLFRLGWGNSPNNMTYSPKKFGKYYKQLNQVYGSYLLCLHIELFAKYLLPNRQEEANVLKLRKHLMQVDRWPEMITFEEANRPVPKAQNVVSIMARVAYADILQKKGFLAGAAELLSMYERESQRATED